MTTAEEKAQIVAEFTVAELNVKPGDVVVVRINEPIETQRQFNGYLKAWAEHEGVDIHFLVVHTSAEIASVLHTLDAEDLAQAGAGDWPHDGRAGVVAGMPDDSHGE